MSLQEKHKQFAVKSYAKNRTLYPPRINYTKIIMQNNKPPHRGGVSHLSCRSDHQMPNGGIPYAHSALICKSWFRQQAIQTDKNH